jgi:adenylate kinase family enzyme
LITGKEMKIHIFGASGSGVTTLGLALAEKLNIAYFDSDTYFWEKSEPPFTIKRNPEERNHLIKTALEKSEDWILGGSIISWGDHLFPAFDLIVFLWIPPEIRINRLKERELQRYGQVIYTDKDRNKLFNDFIAWASAYDANIHKGRTLMAHENWLKKQNSCILQIREDITVTQRIEIVLNELENIKTIKY